MATIASKGSSPLVQREMCGGVLIAPDRVATAGHCLDHADPTHLELHLGGGTLSTDPGRVVEIKGFEVDPGYRLVPSPSDPNNFEKSAAANDAAIIELAQPVEDVSVVPVAKNDPAPGTAVSVFGHGQTKPLDPNNPLSSIGDALSRGEMKILDHGSCNTQLGGVVDGQSVVCAQGTGTTICSGDSGGPLVHYTSNGPELVGLTSFGGEVVSKKCGQDSYPAGFADAAALRSFLTAPDPVLAPMPTSEPAIVGTKAAGATLTCQPPTWTGQAPDSVDYAWEENEVDSSGEAYVPIKGASNGPTLVVTQELATHKLLCVLTAKTAGGVVELMTNPA